MGEWVAWISVGQFGGAPNLIQSGGGFKFAVWLGGCYRSGAVLAGSIWRTFPFWRTSQSGASWAPIWRAQSGESLADLAGILEAANCVAQPFWRDAQSGEMPNLANHSLGGDSPGE